MQFDSSNQSESNPINSNLIQVKKRKKEKKKKRFV